MKKQYIIFMNILYITNVDLTKSNGARIHIEGFTEGAASNGANCRILSKDKIFLFSKNISVYPKLIQIILFNIISSSEVLSTSSKFEDVYVRYAPFVFLPVITAKIFGKRVFLEFNGNLDWEIIELFSAGPLLRVIMSLFTFLSSLMADGIVCVTEGIKDYYMKYYPSFRGKTVVFPNGGFKGRKKKSPGLKRRGVYAASDLFWSAKEDAQMLKEKLAVYGIELDIIMSSQEEGSLESLMDYDYDFGLVVFNEKSRKLKNGVCPIKYFTYLSCGIPVITPDIPDINSITRENGVGFVYRVNRHISEEILKIYSSSNYEEMSQKAYDLVQREYNWENITEGILKWIKRH